MHQSTYASELYVRAEDVAKLSALCPTLRRLASHMATTGERLTLGSCLQWIPTGELSCVLEALVNARTSPLSLKALCYCSVLLANNEGLVVRAGDNLGELLTVFGLYLQVEMLERKGLVHLQHSRLTLESFQPTLFQISHLGISKGLKLSFTRM